MTYNMEDTDLSEPVKPPKKRKHIHFDVPEQFHRRVKMLCVMNGTTLQAYMTKALEEKVSRDEASLPRNSE